MGIARPDPAYRALIRLPGWERRLVRWASSQVGQSFRWGETDCATLAVQAIRVMCGEDSLDPRMEYRTLNEAMRVVVEAGGIRAHLARFGLTEHRIALVQHGDIVVRPPWSGNPLEEASVRVSGRFLCAVEDVGVYWDRGRNASAVALRV